MQQQQHPTEPMTRENRLRDIRDSRGLRQIDLHLFSGVSISMISFIEGHNKYPTREVRQRLAEALSADETEIWP